MAIRDKERFPAIDPPLPPTAGADPGLAQDKRRELFLASVMVPLTVLFLYLRQQYSDIARENGPMENFQAACILAGLILLIICMRLGRSKAEKILVAGIALLYATLLVLEVDLRRVDVGFLNLIWNGPIRDAWLGALWLAALWMFLRNREEVWRVFTAWIRRPSGMVMIAGGACWILSGIVDKGLALDKTLFLEEIIEVNAAWLMLIASAVYWFEARRMTEGERAA